MEADVFHKALITAEAVAKRHRLSTGKNLDAAAGRSEAHEPPQEGLALWQRLDEISVPLVLLWGDHDRASAGERAAAFKAQQPELDVHVVKDSAHMLMADAPDEFTARLSELLTRVAG